MEPIDYRSPNTPDIERLSPGARGAQAHRRWLTAVAIAIGLAACLLRLAGRVVPSARVGLTCDLSAAGVLGVAWAASILAVRRPNPAWWAGLIAVVVLGLTTWWAIAITFKPDY